VPADRDFDIVVFGATGFTGELTAAYLAEHAPPGCRWGLAGRNSTKLEEVRTRLSKVNPECADLPLLHADAGDPQSLKTVAESSRLVITTVGPYLQHGGPLVAACAEAGTDYVDLTGESEFVDRTYLDHHDRAVETGARIVHACGFDSIPHDLGAYFTVQQLPAGEPIRMRGIVRTNGRPSGSTFHSALSIMSRRHQSRAAMRERRRREAAPEGRKARASAGKPHQDPLLGLWLLPLPTIDPFIVARSGAALAPYGPDFRYSHYLGVRGLRATALTAGGATALVVAANIPPVRNALKKRIKQGEGPSESRRARSWFTVDFIGEAGGQTVHTKVSGGDPGYTETAKMLAESALCLAFDDNPPTAGQVTTAQAMGDTLLARLQAAGIKFEVVD